MGRRGKRANIRASLTDEEYDSEDNENSINEFVPSSLIYHDTDDQLYIILNHYRRLFHEFKYLDIAFMRLNIEKYLFNPPKYNVKCNSEYYEFAKDTLDTMLYECDQLREHDCEEEYEINKQLLPEDYDPEQIHKVVIPYVHVNTKYILSHFIKDIQKYISPYIISSKIPEPKLPPLVRI